ncbi:putative gmc oxidoreductase protein [Botrytis fragariae]|uniref:Putative gmc oxidoreductase protein n=1 Tax=Botrytis fragariae TaxID=1964551 RepID=A0A8H6B579_9HELO|nr:putative gmc oxidoreductase protein [Botrytis fragariae]KAF5879222.1 putative gmc oxidoreductase protein [Botrytis fragariae]
MPATNYMADDVLTDLESYSPDQGGLMPFTVNSEVGRLEDGVNRKLKTIFPEGKRVLRFANVPSGSISNQTKADIDAFSSDWPDFEHLFLDASFGGTLDDDRQYVSSSVVLTTPFSPGKITIVSNDTNVYPLVNPNWLTDPRDQEVAVAAFRQARAVFTNNNGTSEIVLGAEMFLGLDVSAYA